MHMDLEDKKTDEYGDLIPSTVQNSLAQKEVLVDIEDGELLDDDQTITTNPDGDVIIEMHDGDGAVKIESVTGFGANLVELIDLSEVDDIGVELVEKYEQDKEARHKRDEQYSEGITRAGLDEDAAPGGASFTGASKIVHPMIAENCVNFAARESRELMPSNGPVKSTIIGKANLEEVEISQRKVDFINTLLTQYMPYRETMEKMLSQLALGGSQFLKFWHDDYLRRPTCEFLPIDMVYIPFECNDFYTAERVTIKYTLGRVEYWRRCKDGMYMDSEYMDSLDDGTAAGLTDSESETKAQRLSNAIEGKESDDSETNEAIDLLEIYAYLRIDGDEETGGDYAPYIVTIREVDGEVVSIYRNWRYDDVKRFKLDYLVKFDFIPWRGAYGIGLGQLIGSLSASATGALRALLDSAHVNNIPTLIGRKGMKMAGQTENVTIGGINMIEGAAGDDGDIRKTIMPLPFNPPSQTLFTLLEWITNAASQVVKMPDGTLDGMGDRTPATTSLAMIEQASMTQSAIHARLHYAQAKCFNIINRLLGDFFNPDGYPEKVIEKLNAKQSLFRDSSDIIPVSDPNIFTEAQRYAQIQMVAGLDSQFPGMINKAELLKRSLIMAKIPDPDLLLNIPTQAGQANAVAENMSVCLGQSIAVFPNQNHLDHIRVHASFLQDPAYGENPLFTSKTQPLIEHVAEHLAFAYASAYQTLGEAQGLTSEIIKSQHDHGEIDKELVELTPSVTNFLHQELQQYMPLVQKLVQQQQAQQQQAQQQNPQMIKALADQQKVQILGQQAQQQAQMQQAQMQQTAQQAQAQQDLERAKFSQEAQTKHMEAAVKADAMAIELEMQRDKDQGQIDIERLKAEINELQVIVQLVQSESKMSFEQQQQVQAQMDKIQGLSSDLSKHKLEMEHSINIEAIKHAEAKELASQAQAHALQMAEHSAGLQQEAAQAQQAMPQQETSPAPAQ